MWWGLDNGEHLVTTVLLMCFYINEKRKTRSYTILDNTYIQPSNTQQC